MIERILPAGVAAVESFGDEFADCPLYDSEREAVAHAVEQRRREFVAARECARRALVALGFARVAIPRGERFAPCWPSGVVGAITHCAGYRAAAVARASEVVGVGIDAEPHAVLPAGVLNEIALDEERTVLRELAASSAEVCWDRVLFSAKESVYKAWFPIARRWLGFEDARITIDPDGTFTARLLVPAPGRLGPQLRGRWLVDRGLTATAVVAPVP